MAYDIIIVGSGPAGLTAGIYAARGQMKTLIIEKGVVGGQITSTMEIENYPGAPADITGPALTERMREQCVDFGVEFVIGDVQCFEKSGGGYEVKTAETTFETKTIIIATGAQPRLLGCPGEKEFMGLGVSYCATCDANFFRGLPVAVIGGGNTALEEALYLAKVVKKVTLIHRRDEFRADNIVEDRVRKCESIDLMLDSVVEEIKGEGLVSGVMVKNVKTGEVTELPVNGVFIFAGQVPHTGPFVGTLQMDQNNYLITDAEMRTNAPGVFAAGDVREKALRQVVTATADGAIAAMSAIKYIEEELGQEA